MTTRREFVIASGVAAFAVATPSLALAQQQGKVWRIGWLSPGSPTSYAALFDAFRLGMRELGYVEGKNLIIETRWADEKLDRLPQLAAELVRLKPDIIVCSSTAGAQAAKAATATIPVVITAASDPAVSGVVASLARPGGNITGLTNQVGSIHPKLLELTHAVMPKAGRIGVLVMEGSQMQSARQSELEQAAKSLGVRVAFFAVNDPEDIDTAFATMKQQSFGVLLVTANAMLLGQRERIVRLAARNRLPAIYPFSQFVDLGGLMYYGVSLADNNRRAATYVDKIFKGAKPADLPIEQPTKFELVINMKTAKALGLNIPQTILVQATRVIE